jgi:iron complex transport system substrate-binding protein
MTTTRPRRGLGAATLLLVLLALIALLGLTGCGGSAGTGSSGGSPSPAASGPITVTDDAGKAVTLKQPAARVVSIAPADTESAFALGAGSKVVGDTTFCDYPAAAKALPKVGDFANPSVEKIVALRPDLVLAAGGIQANLRSELENLGLQVFVVDPHDLAGVMADIEKMGRLMGVSDGAAKVVQQMKVTIAAVQQKVGSLPKAKVFFEIYGKPLMAAGSGTFINDLIATAGGINVGAQAGAGYPSFSTEVLIKVNPDVYVAVKGSQSEPGAIAKRPGYGSLKAVKDGRVYTIADNLVVRPTPRLAQGLEELAKMIHPEAFTTQ